MGTTCTTDAHQQFFVLLHILTRTHQQMELLKSLGENPADIFKISTQDNAVDKFNAITKSLLDEIAPSHSVLDEIYVDGLDASQVYGQAQMVLSGVGEKLLFEKIPELKEKYGTGEESEEAGNSSGEEFYSAEEDELEEETSTGKDQDDEESDQESEDNEELEETEEFQGLDVSDIEDETADENKGENPAESDKESQNSEDSEETKVESESHTKDAFGLNDGFFDIDAFNKQIVALEDEELENDEDIDFFGDLSDEDDSEGEMEYYDEFFDKPGQEQKKVAKAEKSTKTEAESEDSDNELDDKDLDDKEYDVAVDSAMLDLFADEEEEKPQTDNLSSFEKQQQKLQAEIAQLEAELVAEKKWTMKGEVRLKDRPTDSLLDDDEAPTLEFDRTSKPVPVITEEVTESIEDLIKRRVRSDEFDDLPKRLITDVSKFVQRQKTEVSDQKSLKSLAEIYEDTYHGVDPDQKISDEVQQAHDEISDLFTSLNYKLDSLCSAHYVPKPHEFKTIDIKVTDAAASITMEDAQPLHVSDEVKLAPQEVYKIGDDKPKADGARGVSQVSLKSGLAYSKDELSRDDKQRLRRAKKRAKLKHFNELKEAKESREKQQKEQPGGDHKRQRVGEVIDTLSKAKNVTVIDKKGQLRDALGKLRKADGPQSGSLFRL